MLQRNLPARASLAGLALVALAASVSTADASSKKALPSYNLDDVVITAVPVGPTQADVDGVKALLPTLPQMSKFLQGTRFRHIETVILTPDAKGDRATPATQFESTYYDYTNQRVVVASGNFKDPQLATVAVVKEFQPNPSAEEFQEAVAILLSDTEVGPALTENRMYTYGPMPPVLEFDPETGKKMESRVINVGVMPKLGFDQVSHQIIGVDLATQKTVRYVRNAPMSAQAEGSPNCGVPGGSQGSSGRGSPGAAALTITAGGETIWEMTVTRPSASSGTRASGIEVTNVKYRGESVLKRGHVPVLNVLYTQGGCGPYRDWQYQEGMFATVDGPGAVDLIAGSIRDLKSGAATTALENGTDVGNFRGVAIYRSASRAGDEIVMVTEMEAGWYRYIHEWRFGMDGSIRPRFGFGATTNSCTCLTHDHHVYFRLDLDLNTTANSLYEIVGDPGSYVPGAGMGTKILTERKFTRSATQQKYYLMTGPRRHYLLIPGANDGIADSYGKGDMWALKYKTPPAGSPTALQLEFDDGYNNTGGTGTAINLDPFFSTAESIDNQDIVLWCHGTVRHSPTTSSFMCTPTGLGVPGRNILTGDKVVGPDIVPVPF